MGYLDTYNGPLTAKTAAHLLRRATFGPTNQEIDMLVGKTATEAVDLLISNASFRSNPLQRSPRLPCALARKHGYRALRVA